jgi:hypothetical protein
MIFCLTDNQNLSILEYSVNHAVSHALAGATIVSHGAVASRPTSAL